MYQEILAEGREAGLREGRQEGIEEVALNLVRSGMSLEQIASVTGLSIQRVRELRGEQSE
jgi:predicted transposase/invertase (TIGR01784 family)